MKTAAFFASTWHLVQLFILCTDAAGIAISAISPSTATFLNPMLRPLLFIAMNSSVRHSFCSFLRVIPAVFDCIVLVILLLAFFGTTGHRPHASLHTTGHSWMLQSPRLAPPHHVITSSRHHVSPLPST